MNVILAAVIPVVIIGFVCAVVLVVAAKVMAVKEDERFPLVRDCLPGANCGACGFAGCDGYAKALVEKEGTPTNLCIPGADAVSKQLSEVLGVEFEDVVEKKAVVHCSGDCSSTEDSVDYRGIESCSAAKLLFGGKGKCGYGCLGFGDCKSVCPNDAVVIENGLAKICRPYCVGCGLCAKACPNSLISLVPEVKTAAVLCSNKDKGAVTRKVCTSGCIGCRKCEKVCPSQAIKVIDNVAVIDYDKCENCGACAENCTTKCIEILNNM
jgi:Na+-translocating ferredoxin:NAD+ oxidoreductase RNF subunit RnfB